MRKLRNINGFTLAEMLGAIAILVVLMALILPGLFRMRIELRQSELDAKAETIYTAAQNEMLKLRSSGRAESFSSDNDDAYVFALPDDPSDRAVVIDSSGEVEDSPELFYMSSVNRLAGGSASNTVLAYGVADESVLSHAWIVEFDPTGASVYAVWYSEELDLSDYESNWEFYDSLRSKKARIDDGARIGYYGGDSVSSEDSLSLRPTIAVDNSEKLSATVQCALPHGALKTSKMSFEVTLSDDFGHSITKIYASGSLNPLEKVRNTYFLHLVLDDLTSSDTRFTYLWGKDSSYPLSDRLVAGTLLKISVKASVTGDSRISSKTVEAVTNSLFADSSNDYKDLNKHVKRATIEYGRHLQNLGILSESGTLFNDKSAVTEAYLGKNINMRKSNVDGSWWKTYCKSGSYFGGNTSDGTAKFVPVTVDELTSFSGRGEDTRQYYISGLYASGVGDGASALFASVNSFTFTDVMMEGVHSDSKSVAASLVGNVTGTTSFVNCGNYLSQSGGDLENQKFDTFRVSAPVSGGLVGKVDSGANVSMEKCFSATVQNGSTVSGGLVGNVLGRLSVSESFADSYIHGNKTAGLVGESSNSSSVSMADSYAAGYLYGVDTSAGLSTSRVSSSARVYSVCDSLGRGRMYSTAPEFGAVVDTFFRDLSKVSTTDTERTTPLNSYSVGDFANRLGHKFSSDGTKSHPYRLLNQSISTYDYPRIDKLAHYGDWSHDFVSGSLVYYEQYSSAAGYTYGFFGGHVDSSLDDTDVVSGDGYGVVYRVDDDIPEQLTVKYGTETFSFRTSDITPLRIETSSGTYNVYPLPGWFVSARIMDGNFWHKVTIDDSVHQPSVWYANFGFACSMLESDNSSAVPSVDSSNAILVRTPRHLHMLSLIWDNIADNAANALFMQTRSLDYSTYRWNAFFDATVLSLAEQSPIGVSKPFTATYNGSYNRISGVSFVSDGSNIGLFGTNRGDLRNIVITNDFVVDSSHFGIYRTADIVSNDYVSIGALSGVNEGTIENCAVSGFYLSGEDMTVYAYSNSHVYVGGLVGRNSGSIFGCSAVTPEIRISALNAEVRSGGFVGYNSEGSSISSSYDISHTDVAYARGGSVFASGFAGDTRGSIQNSYSASSLSANGDAAYTYTFSPVGGFVSNCSYMNNGTYSFVGTLRTYGDTSNISSGDGYVRSAFIESGNGAKADASHTYSHASTVGDSYPYACVVVDRDGNYVHYGDWQIDVSLGSYGLMYWEHETGGANDGYHLTYLGFAEDTPFVGTTLCTNHDDGGVVTEWGYGYFKAKDLDGTLVSTTGNGLLNSGDVVSGSAADALALQMPGYDFYPYTTTIEDADEFVWLDGGSNGRNGTWTLEFTNTDGMSSVHTYTVNPYFANSISCAGLPSLTSLDGKTHVYNMPVGTDENEYEIRSSEQLQFINWNGASRSVDDLVTPSNYTSYPYLQYAQTVTPSVQSREAVEAVRSPQSWRQSHDVVGNGYFTPIAGMATTCSNIDGQNYSNPLYAFFGGSFDGQSYAIKDVSVVTDAFTVALFGVTAGADVKNVIMHGDGSTEMTRDSDIEDGKVGNITGAYVIGGLVGIAMDYGSSGSSNTISNCAISGYNIIDRSENQQGNGGAVIGGLIGIASVRLERCSAANNILIDCMHTNGHPKWGSYLRVGGLSGSAFYAVKDCYSGGSINVSDRCRDEKPDDWTPTHTTGLTREKASHIYAAGVTASSYGTSVSNFTGRETGQPDGTAYIDNCYTYTQLPDIGGTVRASTLIAGQADRYNRTSRLYINNCYYLQSVRDSITYDHDPEYYFSGNKNLYKMNDDDFNAVLDGDLRVMCKLVSNQSAGGTWIPTPSTGVSYEELSSSNMAGRLNSEAFDFVTVEEGTARIDGKYSFPSGRGDLLGKNYPFPTVIKQKDMTFDRMVNVHYGNWPLSGVFWEYGMASIDMLDDMSDSGWADKEFVLHDSGLMSDVELEFSEDGIVELVGSPRRTSDGLVFKFRALSPGAVTVIARDDSYGASFVLDVTSSVKVSLDTDMVVGYVDTTSDVGVHARSASGMRDYAADSRANWIVSDTSCCDVSVINGHVLVEHTDAGSDEVEVTFVFDYHGYEIKSSVFLDVVTLGEFGLGVSSGLSTSDTVSSVLRARYKGNLNGIDTLPTVKPILPSGVDGEFFLFGSLNDKNIGAGGISALNVSEIDISFEAGGVEYSAAYSKDGHYISDALPDNVALSVSISDDVVYDRNYGYRVGRLSYNGLEPISTIHIVVKATHVDDTGTTYVFARDMFVPEFVVTFDGNGAEGAMQPVRSHGHEVVLPDCGFVMPGHTFDHWVVNGHNYAPSDHVVISDNSVCTAIWRENRYSVVFDANGGTGTMASVEHGYEDVFNLPANTFEHQSKSFAGWATSLSGSVVYADESQVTKLVSEDGGTITLFAVWQDTHVLSLVCGCEPELQEFNVVNNVSSVLDGYVKPSFDGWTLMGWFTEPEGGNKVLDENGVIVGRVPGYTENGTYLMFEDKALYAQWERGEEGEITLVANGESLTYPLSTFFDNYVAPHKDGCELVGFYTTDDETGVHVLNADGTLVDGQSIESGDILYARWYGVKEVVIDDFTPTGTGNARKFTWNVDVDFDAGEKLEVQLDLSTGVSYSARENILGFGKNISKWSGSQSVLIYTWKIADSEDSWLRFELLGTGSRLTPDVDVRVPYTEICTITFEKDKVLCNGTPVNATYNSKYAELIQTLAQTTYQLGSAEGSNRSYASHYNVKVIGYTYG